MENVEHAETGFADSGKLFSPRMEVNEEFKILRQTRKSLGGDALRPIEIDMDILADAYPQEAKFLASTSDTQNAPVPNVNQPMTPKTPSRALGHSESPRFQSSRKTPNRRFFKSENEREYARNLMKELVQIYILQGVHGKDAFRNALNETRRRIHTRRGEVAPLPPPVLSPVHESPYPTLSPPKPAPAPYSAKKVTIPEVPVPTAVRGEASPSRKLDVNATTSPKRLPPLAPTTPSRVKSLVAAIQSTPIESTLSQIRKTPGSSGRVKVVAESIEAQILSSTPSKRKLTRSDSTAEAPKSADKDNAAKEAHHAEPAETSPVRASSRLTKKPVVAENPGTPPKSSRKNEAIVEQASTSRRGRSRKEEKQESPPPESVSKRTRRVAAMVEQESEPEPTTVKRKVAAPKAVTTTGRKKKVAQATLASIPEDEAIVVPARPTRKAKAAANEVIKK